MFCLPVLPALCALVALPALPGVLGKKVTVLPDAVSNGTVTAEGIAGAGSLDGQKLSSVANNVSYEWWYFDVISQTSKNETVTIIFYDAGPEGFPGGYENGPLSAEVTGSFANGSTFHSQVPATVKAVITEDSSGLLGDWQDAGALFRGTDLHKPHFSYVIELKSESLGVFGTVTMRSRAPARYSCGLDVPGTSELAFPGVYWSVAVPDADTSVDLKVHGVPLNFSGIGYHDHNWGLTPFASNIAHTYWGHARVGPYSIVFSQALTPSATAGGLDPYWSVNVAKDNEVVTLSCDSTALEIRPWGANSQYPPTMGLGPPTGIELHIDLGKEGKLQLNVTNQLTLIDESYYKRLVGTVEGVVNGCEKLAGKALWEQFVLIPPAGS